MIGVTIASLVLTNKAVPRRKRLRLGADPRGRLSLRRHLHRIIPVMAMLQAGKNGPFAAGDRACSNIPTDRPNNAVYFWATGLLSSFLDNAPTYLVFFELAGGEAAKLMGPLGQTLAAISLGAVFMGATPISATRRISWSTPSPATPA